MIRLASYALDAWHTGAAPHAVLVNPATEEPLAETSTAGLDFGAMLAHARQVGGPNLRALSFAQRGALLKAMSRALYSQRDRLLDIGVQNGGNSRSDAKFDVDGATATLAYYAGLGEKLGDRKVLLDGEHEQLTPKSARFFGAHALLPRRGAAVHINAFNFPAWGTFEKAAVALLAGVPVITKPATSTAWLAYEMVKIVVDAGLLPAGALQLVAGSPGDLLDHLDGQDVLAFTGSADTGAGLRGGRGPVSRSVRVNIEADSLNALVVGPDVGPGTTTWDWLVGAVALEMTQKTGQKCTAIRRVIAPTEILDELQEAIADRLDRVIVGNPSNDSVRMGPLCTASQLRDYRSGVALLQTAARVVHGDPARVDALDAPAGKGFYAGAVLLRADSADCGPVHRHEVFGPVATLIPYSGDAAEAGAIVAMGGGSLATSVCSDDRAWLSEAALEIAPYNGRILLVDEKVAEQVTPHGLVLPSVVHGGPGRAGGGEELGGLRGLSFYLQRTGLQGNRALLEKLLG